jgi:hypothetical protein
MIPLVNKIYKKACRGSINFVVFLKSIQLKEENQKNVPRRFLAISLLAGSRRTLTEFVKIDTRPHTSSTPRPHLKKNSSPASKKTLLLLRRWCGDVTPLLALRRRSRRLQVSHSSTVSVASQSHRLGRDS